MNRPEPLEEIPAAERHREIEASQRSPATAPSRSHAEREFDLKPGMFPFESSFLEWGGAKLHFVDEGSGPVLFLLHGNPSWSFLYRRMIVALRDRFRCVAMDLPGPGRSS